jgi:hypothetical protein
MERRGSFQRLQNKERRDTAQILRPFPGQASICLDESEVNMPAAMEFTVAAGIGLWVARGRATYGAMQIRVQGRLCSATPTLRE